MPFTISPGVVTKEIDLTTVVPEISMTEGAIAGPFRWGPSYWSTTVSNESELSSIFGKPDAATYKSFFTAASYLAYSGSLKVVRTPNPPKPNPEFRNISSKFTSLNKSSLVYLYLQIGRAHV